MAKPVAVIVGNSSSRATIVFRILQRLGIRYESRYVAEISAVTGLMSNESDYDGCIFVQPAANGDNASSRFLNASHPWPICAPMSLGCLDSAQLVCGQSAAADSNNSSVSITDASGNHVLYTARTYLGTKSANWEANCTPILEYSADTTKALAWHCQTATSNVYYSNMTGDYTANQAQWFAWIAYYLNVIGVTPAKPFRFHVDIDDVQYICDNPQCFTAWGDILRARGAVSVVGVDSLAATSGTSSYAEMLTNTDLLADLQAYQDVLPVILHPHTSNIYASDATYATPATKLAAALAECEGCETDMGVPVGVHHQGYTYLPWNSWSWCSARALILGGTKRLRSSYFLDAAQNYGHTANPGLRFSWPIEAGHDTFETLDMHPQVMNSSGSSSHYTWADLTGGSLGGTCVTRLAGIFRDWLDYGSDIYMTHGGNWIVDAGHNQMVEVIQGAVFGIMDFVGPDFFRFRTAGELLS
jgi:hypothetical protein